MRKVVVLLAFASACGSQGSSGKSSAPLTAAESGTDSADHACQVTLRSFARETDSTGAFVTSNGWFVWQGTVDVAQSLVAQGAVGATLYRNVGGSNWLVATGTPIDGGGSAFQRFQITISDTLVPIVAQSETDYQYDHDELAPFALLADGSRLFDHNRVTDDLAAYEIGPDDFSVPAEPGLCPATQAQGELQFAATGGMTQHGPVTPGGAVTIDYDPARLTGCRETEGEAILWDIEANVLFAPSGTLLTQSVTTVETPGGGTPVRVAQPYTFTVPAGTTGMQVWFRNFDASDSCVAYDSQFGANYQIPVAVLPAPPQWAGDWGNGFSVACGHVDGLTQPVVIDENIREDECMFIDADVYIPGFTDQDGAPAQQLVAQAAYAYDSGATQYDYLLPEGRVGNNQRFRWELPYEMRLSARTFTTASFTFRFSNDGVNFFTIGQADGPTGGSPRTITETTN